MNIAWATTAIAASQLWPLHPPAFGRRRCRFAFVQVVPATELPLTMRKMASVSAGSVSLA